MRMLQPICALVLGLVMSATAADPFQPGDRVLLVGNTFFERDNHYGHVETALALRYPTHDLVIRNQGWSGDNVYGESRSYFGAREEGYKHLIRHAQEFNPTVILLNYGANAAYAGPEGIEPFITAYKRLLEDLQKVTRRIILISPPPCETLGDPLPDMGPQNQRVIEYVDAISSLATELKLVFVDFYHPLEKLKGPLTDNGIHYTDAGYQRVGELFAQALTGKPRPQRADAENLRQAILKKSELFFHHYRPQNETYLRLFRKHEQGNNAAEIAKLAELAAKEDLVIHQILKSGAK
jgi:lysophospholipase L1-like esterase